MSSMNAPGLVIVGAGHCGGRAALALRQQGWKGALTLIGDEPHPPYERPALSKSLLAGTSAFAATHLLALDGWQAAEIDLRLASGALALDTAARQVHLSDGSRVPYARLLLATGGRARQLPGLAAASARVHSVRTYADLQRLQPLLLAGRRLAILGGGFIGLEIAATARELGCEVTLIEGGERLLARAVPAAIAERVAALHTAHGVTLALGCFPEQIQEDAEGVTVVLQNGQRFAADLLVVGIGMQPRIELAQAAGLAVDQGILVDRYLRTSDPHVYAAGDVCQFPSASGQSLRQETWYNAESQAATAAANLLGAEQEYQHCPWFWSDQYDQVLQVGGEPALGVSQVTRVLEAQGLLQFHLDASGRVVAFSGYGAQRAVGRDLKLARKLVERQAVVAAQRLADLQVPLKQLLAC